MGVTTRDEGVCVVIAAYNAEATIARAVASALAEPEVVEIAVVDDASRDATAAAALRGDDGSGRLDVHRLAANAGPSAARNIALARSRAPLIAILDADDLFVPGRFAGMLATPDWDFIADNVAFVDEARSAAIDFPRIAHHRIEPRDLDAAAMVRGSISRPGRYKGELAFLKPVYRRAFIEAQGLLYDETMRLAEDYDLYVRALMAGARFRISGGCGYVSVTRFGSLSHHHGVADLVRFEASIDRLRANAGQDHPLRAELDRHWRQTRRKRRHRELLERKRQVGTIRALAAQAGEPIGLLGAMADIARDKIGAIARRVRPAAEEDTADLRFLL